MDLLHLLENTFDRKRISVYPNPNLNSNPEVQSCFWTDKMTSFFKLMYIVQIPVKIIFSAIQ